MQFKKYDWKFESWILINWDLVIGIWDLPAGLVGETGVEPEIFLPKEYENEQNKNNSLCILIRVLES